MSVSVCEPVVGIVALSHDFDHLKFSYLYSYRI